MAITVTTGLPGHGKTTALAQFAYSELLFSEKVFKKNGHVRPVYSNIVFSPDVQERFKLFIKYFTDIRNMYEWRDCSIIVDELSLYFDAQGWEKLPFEIKRFLRLHRHYDVNIFGAVQDFTTVDITVRRLVSRLYHSTKIISTREPSPYLPPIKFPFSFNRVGLVSKSHWEIEKEHYEYDSYTFTLYTRKDFSIFDTRQELPPQELPYIYKHEREIHYIGGSKDGLIEKKYI